MSSSATTNESNKKGSFWTRGSVGFLRTAPEIDLEIDRQGGHLAAFLERRGIAASGCRWAHRQLRLEPRIDTCHSQFTRLCRNGGGTL